MKWRFIIITACTCCLLACKDSHYRYIEMDCVLASNITGLAITPSISQHRLVLNVDQQRMTTTPDYIGIDLTRPLLLTNEIPEFLINASSYYDTTDVMTISDGTLCIAMEYSDEKLVGYYRIEQIRHYAQSKDVLSYQVSKYKYCPFQQELALDCLVMENILEQSDSCIDTNCVKGYRYILVPAKACCLFDDEAGRIVDCFYYIVKIPEMKL